MFNLKNYIGRYTSYLLFILLLTTSCGQSRSSYQTGFHDNGRKKPKIAICPIFDTSESEIGWSLGEEFSRQIKKQITDKGHLFLVEDKDVVIPPVSAPHLFFEQNWASKTKYPYEFVCIIEVVEHEFTSRDTTKPGKIASQDLDITLRIKVLQLTQSTPVVVLQEFIHQRNYIPWGLTFINYQKIDWQNIGFGLTPVGAAHKKIIKSVAQRIEDYILIHNPS
jgi:hypothetical protein